MGRHEGRAIKPEWAAARQPTPCPVARPFSGHGGRLSAAAAHFPTAPTPWIDLSTGISPIPYPAPPPSRSACARLPDPAETSAVEDAAAQAFGLSASGCTMATPGSEVALRLLPRLLAAQTVAIAARSYGSHAQAWRAAGAIIQSWPCCDLSTADADVLIAVNPNNPDGYVHAPQTLIALAQRQAARGRWLIVDEAFAETEAACSVAAQAGVTPGLIVLRSFGKFYGLAGVRLGFVIAASALISELRSVFGDWPVSATAIAAGCVAYPDADWRARTLLRLTRKAARLDKLLGRAGFQILGGTPLFRLCAADDALGRFICLAERGILTRPFEAEPTWLRFGLPAASASWSRLEQALEVWAS